MLFIYLIFKRPCDRLNISVILFNEVNKLTVVTHVFTVTVSKKDGVLQLVLHFLDDVITQMALYQCQS